MATHSNGLLKEWFCGIHISLLAQPRIHQIAIMINGSIELAPCSMDLDVRLIHIPGSPSLVPSFRPQLVRDQGSKPFFPVPNGLIGENKATFQEHLSHYTQAQLRAQAPENHKENDVCSHSFK
jgi:hypothetical protein